MGYSPRSLIFRAYIDGGVSVEYTVSVDATKVRVNITLFGSQFHELTVEDQEGLPLFYTPVERGLTVDTLGATTITISYLTFDLTNKTGKIWTLSTQAPTTAVVVLPRNSTIVGLSSIPLSIGSVDGSPVLTMPEGYLEVSYIISLEGARERALLAIGEAESTIKAVEAKGVVAKEAEALLKEAQVAFKTGDYIGAERKAEGAKASALEAERRASNASKAIDAASIKIQSARGEGRTIGLDGAESLLRQAEDAYRIGDYGKAEALARQAEAAAAEARAPMSPLIPLSIVGVSFAIIIGAISYILKRRRSIRPERAEGVSLEDLLEKRPDLRFEDREVLRFLAESGGEAFASEIRERFNMPRASAWRLIRRLGKEGLVEVEEVRGQTLVRLKRRWRGG